MASGADPITLKLKRTLFRLWTAMKPEEPGLPSGLGMGDSEFLSLFNVPEVLLVRDTEDVETAQRLLLQHFAQRDADSWPEFAEHTRELSTNRESLIAVANDILEGRIVLDPAATFHFDAGIYWHRPLNDDPRARPTRKLNRHHWLMIPARVYELTGDERFARYIDHVIQHWIASAPRPDSKDEWSTSWALMEVGMRCMVWPRLFGILQPSVAFTGADRLMMLRSIYEHAEFLNRYHNDTNHLLREANGLACVATAFPEFVDAEKWWATATDRLHDALRSHVHEDGSYFEVSTGYQVLAIEEFERAADLLGHRGDPRELEFQRRLPLMYRALASITRPDGSLPLLNDGYVDVDWGDMLARAARRFHAPDLEFVATAGQTGDPPPALSTSAPDAGWHVQRSSWGPDAAYLLFDCGPYGGQHGHEDKLSIELYAHGTVFLGDPGCYTYDVTDPFRAHFMSSRAHNTLVVSGMSQVRRWRQENRKARLTPGPHGEWSSNELFDYAASEYSDGYAPFAMQPRASAASIDRVVHQRHVVFLKPDYWLLIDEVTSPAPQDFELLFQTGAGVRVERSDAAVELMGESGARLVLVCDRGDGDLEIQFGCDEPISGWDSRAWWHKVPAYSLAWRWSQQRTLRVATVLFPVAPGAEVPSRLTVSQLALREGSGMAWQVRGAAWNDVVILGPDHSRKVVSDLVTSARVAAWRRNNGSETRAEW